MPRRPPRAPRRRASRRCRDSTRSDARAGRASAPGARRRHRSSRMSTADESPQETFISHLVELRSRRLKSIVAVLVVFLALAPFSKDIYSLVARPLMHALPVGATMIATDVTGTFLVPLKVTLLAAFLVALPWVLWQIWAFVAPGLYQHEQRLALPLIVSSVVLFFAGMAFAYFVVFPW